MIFKYFFGRNTRPTLHRPLVNTISYTRPRSHLTPQTQNRRTTLSLIGIISLFLLAAACLLGIGYWLLLSGSFQIARITVTPAATIDSPPLQHATQIEERVWELLRKKSYRFLTQEKSLILVRTRDIERDLMKYFPLTHAQVVPILPHTLSITITERVPRYTVHNAFDSLSYLIDNEGKVIAPLSSVPPPEPLWTLTIDHPGVFSVNENTLPEGVLQFCNELYDSLSMRRNDFSLTSLDLRRTLIRDIIAHTNESWQIYFSLSQRAHLQVANVVRALQEMKNDRAKLTYIDVRIPTRIFYQ